MLKLFPHETGATQDLTSCMAEPVSIPDVISNFWTFLESEIESADYISKHTFKRHWEESLRIASLSEKVSQCLFQFCVENKEKGKLKIVSKDVPEGILPLEYCGVIHDISVNSRYGPDDKIYLKNPEIQKKIPRGLSILDLKKNGQNILFDVIVHANKKFTGDAEDEDDYSEERTDNQWRSYFLQPLESADYFVGVHKVNGEAAHFSGRYIDGEFFIFTGSKNVHMVIQKESDVDKYKEDRYRVARDIAKEVCRTLETLKSEHLQLLKSFIHHFKLTLVCEITQKNWQHIVDLSELPEFKLHVVLLANSASETDDTSLTAFPPHYALTLMRSLGLVVTCFKVFSCSEIDEHKAEVRAKTGIEGEVFCFVSGERIIGIAKFKTAWYIILRAIREKACYWIGSKKCKWDQEKTLQSTHKRLREIQKWLRFSDEYLKKWQELAKGFLMWLNGEVTKKSGKYQFCEKNYIRPHFPQLWKEFLCRHEKTDEFPFEKQ